MNSTLGACLVVCMCVCICVSVYVAVRVHMQMRVHAPQNDRHRCLPISAGILTHYAPKTLSHTLQSYKAAGLLNVLQDVFVIIQHSSRAVDERRVCEFFNVRYVLMNDNGHMASGFRAIYDHARHDVLLFLENDFILHEDQTCDDVSAFFDCSLRFLSNGYDVVRARSRAWPGDPNYAVLHHDDNKPLLTTHMSESMYWEPHPHRVHVDKIFLLSNTVLGPWYTSTAAYCNYTNNPFLCRRSFFTTAILPHLVFGENIEDRLTPIWATMPYKCVFGPGLFTHDRSFDGHS